jgi:phage terminase large subunit-like protein
VPAKKKAKQKTRSPRSARAAATTTPSRAPENPADQYAREVVAGKIDACKWVVLACRRHIRDRKREAAGAFPYVFSVKRAARKCALIEQLPHTKGKWAAASERIRLEAWQKFIVYSLFGWIDRQTKRYRFTEAYIAVPRKNGKSILGAGIGHIKFAADDEFGAEVYSGATSEKQAWEVFRPARLMAKRTPAYCEAFGIEVNSKSLTIEENGSRFEPVIGKPGDGASPSCAIVDEYHEHATDELVETMASGMGARDNPLLLKITTAGSNRASPCYQSQKDGEKILENKIENDRVFVIIYTIDETDDWKSELALKKANPNFGVSVSSDYLIGRQKQAIDSARKQNAFKTKHLNIWVNAAVAWMNMDRWDAAADPALRLEDFEKEDCWIGIDLASRIDLAVKLRLFRRTIDGKKHFFAFCSHYLNEGAVEASKNSHYAGWAADERLIVTPGSQTDYLWIAEDLVDDSKRFLVRQVPHDPYHAAALIQFIQARPDWDQTVEFVEIRQTVENMSAPMKELEAIVLDGRFHHDGDPVLGWMVSNVVCKTDNKANIFPLKEREEAKIDGAVALIMALGRAMLEEIPSDYPLSIL